MKILELAANLLSRRQPTILILFVTSRCNAGCSFCFYADRTTAQPGSEPEFTTEEYRLLSERCGQIPYLLLSGGEPLLREDITEIIRSFIKNAGTRFVTIPSNGLLPEKMSDTFDELTSMYPGTHFRAALSVDFPDERHDRMRARDGCLDRLLESAALVRKLRDTRKNLTLEVVSVYMPENSGEHRQLHAWVKENIQPDNHELHILRPHWPATLADGIDGNEFLETLHFYRSMARRAETRWMSSVFRGLTDEWMRAMHHLVKGKRLFPCRAGSKIVVIDESGKVRLCELRPEILGDLRETGYDLTCILRSETARNLRKQINQEGCTCTWECAMVMNILMTPRFYPGLLRSALYEMVTARK